MSANRSTDPERPARRHALRWLGGVAGGAALATALPVAAPPAEAYDPGSQETRSRYKPDSPDVQAFYRTNRYES